MLKNGSGQKVGAQLVSATDGSAFTGSVTVAVTVDAGTQATGSVGSGACAHEGGGYHTYSPAQAETNGDLIAFTFSGTGAVPVTVQVYTLPATGILAPTTAGRTLDVSAGGEAGVDWANVGSPTTSLALTGTTIATTQKVDVETIKTNPVVNGGTITFPTTATLASMTNITAGTITTATNLTNAPPDSSGVTTLLSRIPSALFSGITSMAHWLGALAGKQAANATAQTEIRASGAGSGTFDPTTDSMEAVRDRGDAAWITATGFSTLDAVGVRTAVGLASANLDTQLADLPTNAELTTALTNLDAAVSTRATPAQVNTEADTALSDVGVTLARMGALTDWIDGGRLDLLLDSLVADNPNRPAIGVELPNVMFLMVDATDLNTPETGVTVTATISKDGGAFAACTNAVSEVSGGWYKITLTSTEMNATSIAVKFTGTGCAQRNIAIRTQPT